MGSLADEPAALSCDTTISAESAALALLLVSGDSAARVGPRRCFCLEARAGQPAGTASPGLYEQAGDDERVVVLEMALELGREVGVLLLS